MEPLGWDAQDRSYFVLDDDRLYRKTEPPPAKLQPKPSPKKSKTTKSNKRKRTSTVKSESERDEHEPHMDDDPQAEDDGFGGMKWECLAVTLEDYQSFMETIRSRDPNEKAMYKRLKEEVLPVIEKKAEEQMRRAARKQRELENLEKLARAKRSSRIADKQERRREMEQSAEAERKRLTDLAMAKKEQEKQRKLEEVRGHVCGSDISLTVTRLVSHGCRLENSVSGIERSNGYFTRKSLPDFKRTANTLAATKHGCQSGI